MSKKNSAFDLSTLEALVEPVQPDDLMAEAGRKILLKDFIKMLKHEDGSRSGEDIEDVHDMRVATRRMRSALRLLDPYFKSKIVRGYRKELSKLADALGQVRDFDVLIADIDRAMASVTAELSDEGRTVFEPVHKALTKKRARARKKLIEYLDSKPYRKFCAAYTDFLSTPGQSATLIEENSPEPIQARHVVPVILHEHLATVRAYDPLMNQEVHTYNFSPEQEIQDDALDVLPGEIVSTERTLPDSDTLHSLRIAFKRLRYATSYFVDILGTTGEQFIEEIKVLQDILGRLQDIRVAEERVADLIDSGIEEALFTPYLQHIEAEKAQLEADLLPAWDRFNTRTVQSKLSNALLVLR